MSFSGELLESFLREDGQLRTAGAERGLDVGDAEAADRAAVGAALELIEIGAGLAVQADQLGESHVAADAAVYGGGVHGSSVFGTARRPRLRRSRVTQRQDFQSGM